jgi:hypothetical protein
MREIKRYIPAAGVIEDERIIYMRHNDKGEWVRHTDHLAALNQAKIDAVREFADALWDTGELSGRDGEFVVSFSKEFIEQLKEQGE